MNRRTDRPFALLVPLSAALALLTSVATAETYTTPEFLARQPAWAEMAEKEESIRVEGRIESASPQLLKLRKIPLHFRPHVDPLPDLQRHTTRVEATGKLGRRGTDLVFFVTLLKPLPDDIEVYALKESALDAGDPADWYALGAWASERGEFFEDPALRTKAREARRKGLALEREAGANAPAVLAELAKKAAGFGLPELQRALTHESLRGRWDQARAAAADPGGFAEEVAASLPGAATPLAEWPTETAARYAAEPLAAYNRANEQERAVLDRLFFAEARLGTIERAADPAGANGDFVAGLIDASLPERAAIADRYRERELAYRRDRIAAATRSEALELAKRLEERGRADEAREALLAWLAAREASLRQDGPAGLTLVAEDYADVLGDKATAARLLVEALKESPKSELIPAKLRQLGYVPFQGEWITKEEAGKRPVDPITLAMREGRVTAGMSAEQVRKTLGAPDRIARTASLSQVHEAWVYGEAGRGGLVVHLLRYSARGKKEGQVVGVAALRR